MNDQKSLIDRVSRVTGDMAGNPVVSATKERAQKASRVAKSQLPATREDVARLQEQLDRVEATLTELAGRIEAPAKPRRRQTSGSAKTES
jgi:ubiquinone biosynthesis protein UbiJ